MAGRSVERASEEPAACADALPVRSDLRRSTSDRDGPARACGSHSPCFIADADAGRRLAVAAADRSLPVGRAGEVVGPPARLVYPEYGGAAAGEVLACGPRAR